MNAQELIDGLTSGKLKVAEVATLDGAGKSADVLATFTYAAERQEPVKVKTAGERMAEKMVNAHGGNVVISCPGVGYSFSFGSGRQQENVDAVRGLIRAAIDSERADAAREAAEQMREACAKVVAVTPTSRFYADVLISAIRALPLPAATTEGRE